MLKTFRAADIHRSGSMRRVRILGAAIALCCAGATAHAGTFSDPLTNGINATYWTLLQTNTGEYSDVTNSSGVTFSGLANKNTGLANDIELDLNMSAIGGPISGDFSVSVDISGAQIGPGLDQIQLNGQFQGGGGFDLVRDPSGVGTHIWTGNYLGGYATSATSGVLSITRVGDLLSGFFDGNLIYSSTTLEPTQNLTEVVIQLQNNSSSQDATAVTFSNFSITGSSVTVPSGTPEPSSFFLAIAGIGMGIWRIRRPAREPRV